MEKGTEMTTREHLLKAGRLLFARRGYDGTSVKEIADQANANVALVSYHFGGKEGLYKACFESFVEERLDFLNKKIRFFKKHIFNNNFFKQKNRIWCYFSKKKIPFFTTKIKKTKNFIKCKKFSYLKSTFECTGCPNEVSRCLRPLAFTSCLIF